LRIANDSRAVIDQAKGIVMALRGVDAGAAFGVLVARSQQENVKLRVVAEQVVRAVARRAPIGNAL
jgi:AmiR/NasT family two-component response regulator